MAATRWMARMTSFLSIYRHGFARVAACTTRSALADPATNAATILAHGARLPPPQAAALAVFPELACPATRSTTCCCRTPLLDAVEQRPSAARRRAPADLLPVLLVGAPLRHAGRLYNCALAIHRGRLLGVVPKIHLPNYREFYERRHFASGDGTEGGAITLRRAGGARSGRTCCSPPRICPA